MDENRFEQVIRDLPEDYKVPDAPLEEMWRVIESAHFDRRASARERWTRAMPWLATAAALVIGIGIGRYFPTQKAATVGGVATATPANNAPSDTSAVADAYRDQTSRYLGQAAALLISLPAKDASAQADTRFANEAADLLVTTRLLIDSPAANQDLKLRSLLDDLELLLVQIARLRGERNKGDLDLIHQAVEQGDVLSRLNSAVATTQSSE
jgi:hypothetical protein